MNIKIKTKDKFDDLPKDMSKMEADFLEKRLKNKVSASPGRKRPRNSLKRRTLLRWERERGGKKIGEI